MKKMLFIFLITITYGCNKNDDNQVIDNNLEINEQNILGKWFLKGGTKNGGIFENYTHLCSTSKDYQEFLSTNNINFIGFDANCQIVDTEASGWQIINGNVLMISNYDPIVSQDDIYTILSITTEELKLKQTANTPNGEEIYEIYLTRD
jgi:hypothetical protein